MPDFDLRQQMVKDIRDILLPMYERFYDRYNGNFSLSLKTASDFSKNPEKYIKHKKDGIASILSKLYEDNK